MLSEKQKVQRDRYTIKGFCSNVVGSCNRILHIERKCMTGVERDLLMSMRDSARGILKDFSCSAAPFTKKGVR